VGGAGGARVAVRRGRQGAEPREVGHHFSCSRAGLVVFPAFLGQGKCVTRPSLTQWQQEETRPTTRTLCIYDTVTLALTRPSHRARA
jgi:hypothetical protein